MQGGAISGTLRVTSASDRVTLRLLFDREASREVRASFDPARFALELPEGLAGAPAGPLAAGFVTIEPTEREAELSFVRKGEGPAGIGIRIVQGVDLLETKIDLEK